MDDLEQRKKMEQIRQEILTKFLTKEARERLGNLKYAHPELAEEIENMLMQSAVSGRLKSVIDDEKLKELFLYLLICSLPYSFIPKVYFLLPFWLGYCM